MDCNSETGSAPAGRKIVTVTDSLGLESFTISRARYRYHCYRSLDVSSAYKTKPDAFGLPFLSLPNEINLGDASMEDTYKKATVSLNGKDVTSRAAGLLRRFVEGCSATRIG
jgi:hypothetical protein